MEGGTAKLVKPKFLRTPFSLLSNQDESQEWIPPPLLKNTTPHNIHKNNLKIFKLPIDSSKENKVPFLSNKEPSKVESIPTPRLIDLRPILQLRQSTSKNNCSDPYIDKVNISKKVPQLIRLPNLHQEPQKQFLESPKREIPRKKRNKPKDPKVIDVRNEICMKPKANESKEEKIHQLPINKLDILYFMQMRLLYQLY